MPGCSCHHYGTSQHRESAGVGWRIWLSLICLLLCQLVCQTSAGIPGGMQTINGYDTEFGTDSICWSGQSDFTDSSSMNETEDSSLARTPWSNKLVEDFVLKGDVVLLRQCPNGTAVTGGAPQILTSGEERVLRTGMFYDYRVKGEFNLEYLKGDKVTSDTGAVLAIQVLLCELGQVGFCSPFVHEQANARLAAQNATVPIAVGDRHGNTHVHSPTVKLELTPSSDGRYVFDAIVPVKVNHPGSFFAVGAFQFFTMNTSAPNNGTEIPHFKYDVANALDKRLITYQEPVKILKVSKPAEIVVGLFIGLATAAQVFLLCQTYIHRNDQVIRLSQGPFLMLFLVAAIFASLCSFLFNPKNDLFCRISSPMVLIPLQLMYSINIGRLWRINAVISPLLMMSLQRDGSISLVIFGFLSRLMFCDWKCPKKRGSNLPASALRVKVSSVQLVGVIAIFTLPQVIIQFVKLVAFPPSLHIDLNEEESVGRTVCGNPSDRSFSLILAGVFTLLVLFAILLLFAHQSRKLPSLFNETESMYNSSFVSIIVASVSLAILVITNQPTTSPDVAYILSTTMVLTMTLNTTVRITLPKLRMVWKGEKVVVSRLVSDHRSSSKVGSGRSELNRSKPFSSVDLKLGGSTFNNSSKKESSVGVFDDDEAEDRAEGNNDDGTQTQDTNNEMNARPNMNHEWRDAELGSAENGPPRDRRHSTGRRTRFRLPTTSRHLSSYRKWSGKIDLDTCSDEVIHVKDDATPSRRLVLRMVDTQAVLTTITQQIMSGQVVTHDNWELARDACTELGCVFKDGVKFEWEELKEDAAEEQEQPMIEAPKA